MVVENTTPVFQAKENYYVRKGLTPLEEPAIRGMKLLGDVSIGNLVLNTRDADGIVWVCTEIENWWTLPEPEFPKVERSFGDGSYDVSGRYLPREVTLQGSILVPEPLMARAARDKLAQALNLVYSGAWLKTVERQATKTASVTQVALASNVATLTIAGVNPFIVGDVISVSCSNSLFSGTYAITAVSGATLSFALTASDVTAVPATGAIESGDSLVKAAWVRLADQPDIVVKTPRGRIEFEASLTAADPIKYSWAATNDGYTTVDISPKSEELSGEYTISNTGNAAVGGVIIVGGPIYGPLTIKNTTTNQTLTVNAALSGSDTTLDVAKRSYFAGYATLTTKGNHGLYVGKTVTVAGVDSQFDGTHVVSSVPSDVSFSYPLALDKSAAFTGYKLGETIQLASRVVADYVATITSAAAHALEPGMQVFMSGFSTTGAANALNGRFEVSSVPSSTTFTVKVPSLQTLSDNATAATAVVPVATIYSDSVLPFSVGDAISVKSLSAAVNISNGTVLSVAPDGKSIRYYADRIRAIRAKTYEPASSAAAGTVTLTTWEPHGYRVGSAVLVEGCGRPVNSTTGDVSYTVTAATSNTFSFAVPSFNETIANVTVSKLAEKKYRVFVVTSNAHSFATGDSVLLRVPMKGGRTPAGVNGTFAITKLLGTSFFYDVTPKSTTKQGLIEFFGAESGSLPISAAAKVALAPFKNVPINASGQNSTGGRAISFAIIPLTSNKGQGDSEIIDEVDSNGTVASGTDELLIDTSKRSVLINGQAEYARGKLEPVTDWVKFAPGNNELVVEDAGNQNSTAAVTLRYRSGWLA